MRDIWAKMRFFGLVADAESSHATVERRAPDAKTFGGGDHISGSENSGETLNSQVSFLFGVFLGIL